MNENYHVNVELLKERCVIQHIDLFNLRRRCRRLFEQSSLFDLLGTDINEDELNDEIKSNTLLMGNMFYLHFKTAIYLFDIVIKDDTTDVFPIGSDPVFVKHENDFIAKYYPNLQDKEMILAMSNDLNYIVSMLTTLMHHNLHYDDISITFDDVEETYKVRDINGNIQFQTAYGNYNIKENNEESSVILKYPILSKYEINPSCISISELRNLMYTIYVLWVKKLLKVMNCKVEKDNINN